MYLESATLPNIFSEATCCGFAGPISYRYPVAYMSRTLER